MLHKTIRFLPLFCLVLASCSSNGDFKNPFVKTPTFVSSPVPADFALVIDENQESFYERQHVQQVITAADTLTRTTYTTFRERNDVVAGRFTQETTLTPEQLQAMWDDVSRNELLAHSTLWINWYSGADIFQRNSYTIQIRANGRTCTYHQTNGFSGAIRPLMLQANVARYPATPGTVITSAMPTSTQPRPQP